MSELAPRDAESDTDVAACFPLMTLLRPTLVAANELAGRVGGRRRIRAVEFIRLEGMCRGPRAFVRRSTWLD